ncbi:MAG TPA: lysylphosphatidylglycerol synthase transmembrane domain-containing protein [Dissulfurispiraceae bacterium]|nr:lysylphosphatidylglycerol synthase transmembrane domain-containing protein [Dissulfurispiraceae bacterium]
MHSVVKKILLIAVKLVVSASLMTLLLTRTSGDALLDTLRQATPVAFAGAVACYLAAVVLSCLRWRMLIPQTIGLRRLFSLYMVGSFFNTCLPGLVGGDAVKAYYLAADLRNEAACPPKGGRVDEALQHGNAPYSVAFASVFMDRYIGLAGLLALGLFAYPFGREHLASLSLVWAFPAVFAGFLAVSLLLMFLRLPGKIRFLATLSDYFHLYRSDRALLAKTFIYSLAIQMLGFVAVFWLAQGLGLGISLLHIAVFLPLIILLTLLPVSISGLGVREGAFVFFFGALGVASDKAIALSLLWFLSIVAAGLWGLIEYLRIRAAFRAEKKEQAL